nr:unnamed protein product [Callosobruchus chinensis]
MKVGLEFGGWSPSPHYVKAPLPFKDKQFLTETALPPSFSLSEKLMSPRSKNTSRRKEFQESVLEGSSATVALQIILISAYHILQLLHLMPLAIFALPIKNALKNRTINQHPGAAVSRDSDSKVL